MTSPFRLEPLSNTHNRTIFRCGVEALDRYFREQATQDIRRRISNCFVAADQRTGEVAGFYTLAAASVSLTELPLTITKRLPRYPVFPAIQIGRLAVDSRYQGRGVGSGLLADATLRSARAEPAAFTLLVDAKNDNAAAFYRKFGFSPFASRPLTLLLPITTALKLASDQLVKASEHDCKRRCKPIVRLWTSKPLI